MPRLQGPDIFSSEGSCLECGAIQSEHRRIPCGYPRKDYEGRKPCEGICMYRRNPNDGILTCCSVCPHCGIPPIDDPNDVVAEEETDAQNGTGEGDAEDVQGQVNASAGEGQTDGIGETAPEVVQEGLGA